MLRLRSLSRQVKTVPMEVSSRAKVRDLARRVPRTRSESSQDVYESDGRVLKGSEELGSCGVRDGSTLPVAWRLRGGGRNKGMMPGGGLKKTQKKEEQRGQSTTDKVQ